MGCHTLPMPRKAVFRLKTTSTTLMKNFTLLFTAAIMAVSTASAQTVPTKAVLPASAKALYAKFAKKMHAGTAKAENKATTLRVKRAAENSLWRAQHDEQYSYDGSGWSKEADNTYTYTQSGLTKTQVQAAYGEYAKIENTYNEKDQITDQLMSISEDGTTYTPYAKRTQTYDERTGIVTSYASSIYDAEEDSWSQGSGSNKTVIERDGNGNITKVTKYRLDDDREGYVEYSRLEMSYTDGANGPTDIKSYELDDDSGEEELDAHLTNVTWAKSDGQLTSVDNPEDFLTGNNIMKSCTMEDEEGTLLINVTTDENGGYEMKATIEGFDYAYQTASLKYTDDNGSYCSGSYLYYVFGGKEQLAGCEYIVETFDDNHNSTLYEEYETDEDSGETELVNGKKHEYTYGGPHGEMTESIEHEFDYYNRGEYKPSMRIVYDSFIDAAAPTGVQGISGTDSGEATFYNLQGMKVDGTAKGLLIMKRGGKAVKVMK